MKRVQAGETADVVVLTRQSLDTLAKEGKAAAEATSRAPAWASW